MVDEKTRYSDADLAEFKEIILISSKHSKDGPIYSQEEIFKF